MAKRSIFGVVHLIAMIEYSKFLVKHCHLIPRYSSPRIFEGMTFTDDRLGHNYWTNHDFVTSPKVLDAVRNRLRKELLEKS